MLPGWFWNQPLTERQDAQARSIELLRAWLNPEQLREYEEFNYFTVRGSDTGDRYRIDCTAAPYNVALLHPDGYPIERFCVTPKDITTRGDILLSQKIWFETDELGARCRANRDVLYRGHVRPEISEICSA